jgi:phosphoribosylanthranilate isomerase
MPSLSANSSVVPDELLADPALETRIKVCGAKASSELDLLAAAGVDFVGLWYAVPGGPHDLPLEQWRALAQAVDGRLAPVLVTFSKDAETLREAIQGTPVVWIQLHGYPTPGVVRKMKAIAPDVKVIKVLHVRGAECVEASLIAAYEKAGVDVFLFDTVTEDGRVGSTGQTLDPAAVAPLADQLTRPFLLAGGISAENRSDYEALANHPRFLGIDVDTNARGSDHKISAEHVAAIARAWKQAHA